MDDQPNVRRISIFGGGKAAIVGNLYGDVHFHSHSPSRAAPDPFATVPPRINLIERAEVTEPAIDHLLNGPGSTTLAVHGIPGAGKSYTALAVCHDPHIRQRFTDGIVWLPIGKESERDFEDHVRVLCGALGQEYSGGGERAYRTALASKAVLIVLDDVWASEDVEPFLLDGGYSRLLYTTRDRSLAGPLGAKNLEVGVVTDDQAKSFLARWAGLTTTTMPQPHAAVIIDECGGLALALSMLGAALRDQAAPEWARIAEAVTSSRRTQLGRRPSRYKYHDVHASVAVSVDWLPTAVRERYRQLAVLLDGMTANTTVLMTLWGQSDADTLATMRTLVDRSLATWASDNAILVHDVQLDYLRAEHHDQHALSLIQAALTLSRRTISVRPAEFRAQLLSRLWSLRSSQGIAQFLEGLQKPGDTSSFTPLRTTVVGPHEPVVRILEAPLPKSGDNGWTSIALSHDARFAVSGCVDGTVWCWRIDQTIGPKMLTGHSRHVTSVAISANGDIAISASWDKTIRIWNLSTPEQSYLLTGHSGAMQAVAISADATVAVAGSDDGTVTVWSGLQEPPQVLRGHNAAVTSVAISSDGQCVASGSLDKTIRVWNLSSNAPPVVLADHGEGVIAVDMSADGRFVASAAQDDAVLWHDVQGKVRCLRLGSHNVAKTIAISSNGKYVVTGGADFRLRVWATIPDEAEPSQMARAEGQNYSKLLSGHTSPVEGVDLSADGRWAISAGSWDKTLRLWDLSRQDDERSVFLRRHMSFVFDVTLVTSASMAMSVSADRTLRVWEVLSDEQPRVLSFSSYKATSISLASDARHALLACDDGKLRLLDLLRNHVRLCAIRNAPIEKVAFAKDGANAAYVCADGTLNSMALANFWRDSEYNFTETGLLALGELYDPKWHIMATVKKTFSETDAAMSDNSEYAVFAYEDNVHAFDFGAHEHTTYEHKFVRTVAISDDGRRAVSGGFDGNIKVWNLPQRTLEIVIGDAGQISTVQISSHGQYVVCGDERGVIRLIDLERGMCVATFTCDAKVACSTMDGDILAVGDAGGDLYFFRISR